MRNFNRRKVFAEHVFDQRELQTVTRFGLTNKRRDLREARQAGGAPAALSGNEFVSAFVTRAHHNGLHYAVAAYRLSQSGQPVLVEVLPWLMRVGMHLPDRQITQAFVGFGIRTLVAQQRCKAPTQSASLRRFTHALLPPLPPQHTPE